MGIEVIKEMREAAYLLDEHGRFRFVNDEACRASGYSRGELLSLRVGDLDIDLTPENWPLRWSDIARYQTFRYESRHRTKGGEIFPVEVTSNHFELEGRGFILDLIRNNAGNKPEDVARAVIHNVGNVLNGLKVSNSIVARRIRNAKGPLLGKVVDLLRQHAADLPAFFSTDPRGKQVPIYLENLARQILDEQVELLVELEMMAEKVEHIRAIVDSYQDAANVSGRTEWVPVAELVEAALRITAAALESLNVSVIRQFSQAEPIMTDRHKVLQILVNLITNASQALERGREGSRQLTLQIESGGTQNVRISVTDNGIGIDPENLPRIFRQGFTTRREGHGLGLHRSALLAMELGGQLTVASSGRGHGAIFTLELPLKNAKRTGE